MDPEAILAERFADQISFLKSHPRDREAMRRFIDNVIASGIEFRAKQLTNVFADARFSRCQFEYFAGFLVGYIGRNDQWADTIRNQINHAPWPDMDRLAGYYGAIGNLLTSDRLYRLARCFEAIHAGGGQTDIRHDLAETSNENGNRQPASKNWICFVTECNLTVRMRKLAYAVRQSGAKVRLIIRKTEHFPAPREDEFDEIFLLPPQFEPLELWEHLDSIKPLAIHCFVSDRHGYMEALSVMAARPDICVVDFYDFSHPDVGPLKRLKEGSKEWNEFELHTRIYRFLLNHMSGNCSRTLYNRLQCSSFGDMKRRQSRIAMPEYCWGHEPQGKKLSRSDGMIHAVVASTFFIGSDYNDTFSGYPLMNNAERLNIHLHLYALTFHDANRDKLAKLVAEMPNCHLHDPLPYEEWQSEAGKYDVGLFRIYPRDEAQIENIPLALDPTRGWSNKFGDYLDGNVYMVFGSDLEYQAFVAKRYGIGESADEDVLLSLEFWEGIREKVLNKSVDFDTAKKILNVQKHGPRLIEFYQGFRDNNPYLEQC